MTTVLLIAGTCVFFLGVVLVFSAGVLQGRERMRRRPRVGAAPRSSASPLLAIGVVLCIAGPGSCTLGCAPSLRPHWWLPSVARRGDELVAAIRRYERDAGHAPAHLEELVPHYLDTLPGTGFLGDGRWAYTVDGTTWTLGVRLEEDRPKFDHFLYDPVKPGTVPMSSWPVTRRGDWVFVRR